MRSGVRSAVLLTTLALAVACGEPTTPGGPTPVGTAPVGGGTVQSPSGTVQLVFPPGAVTTSTPITVEPLTPATTNPALIPGTAFDFGPDGIRFAQPVQLTIAYDQSRLPAGTVEGTLALHKQFGTEWRVVAGSVVDAATNRVSAPITGFSAYAVLSLGTPAASIHQGDAQEAIVGTAVRTAPSVLVRAPSGDPIRGLTVTFAVSAGGGAVQHATATTDSAGVASAGTWTLGTTAGENTLTATVEGAPALTFRASGRAACDYAPAYTLGATETGTLADSDCVDGSGRRVDYHTITVPAQLSATLTMSSTAFTPLVGIVDAQGVTMATQYVASPGFTRVVLAPGTYRVTARAVDASARGAYTLTVAAASHDLAQCDVASRVFMTVGASAGGTFGAGDCADTVGDPQDRVDWFSVWLTAGETYRATMTAADAKLSLWGPAETATEIKDFGAGPGNVALVYKATTTGWHTLNPLGRPGTAYQVAIEKIGAVDACTLAPAYTVGSRVEGHLTAGDCVDASGRRVDLRTLTVAAPLSATLTMTAGGFDPLVGITTTAGVPVATQYTVTPGHARVVLAPGTYRITTRAVDATKLGWYSFVLAAADHDVDGCDAATNVFLGVGAATEGRITAGDCVDQVGDASERLDAFSVWMRAGETYRATLTAATAKLSLWGPNGTASVLQDLAAAPGAVAITYTATHDGWHTLYAIGAVGTAYSIGITGTAAANACANAPLFTLGSTMLGMLTDADCTMSNGSRVDRYTLTTTSQLSALLRLGSDAFTPFVNVESSAGDLLTTQYVSAPGFSRVVLAPGTYRILARSTQVDARGVYGLTATAQSHTADGCGSEFAVFVMPGVTHAAQVGAADCADAYGDPTHRYDSYAMRMDAGRTYRITLAASAASWVSLWAPGPSGPLAFTSIESMPAAGTRTLTFTATQTAYHAIYVGGTPGFTYTVGFAVDAAAGGFATPAARSISPAAQQASPTRGGTAP